MLKFIKILCFFFSIIICADLELKSNDGKIYILHDNGTWSEKEVKINNESEIECTYSENKIDDFDGSHQRTSTQFKLGKTNLGNKPIFKIREIKQKDVHVAALLVSSFGELGCMSSRAKLDLKLSDGSFIELQYSGSIDCSKYASFMTTIFAGCKNADILGAPTIEDLNKLKTIPLEMIRITGGDYYTDVVIDDDKKYLFSNYLKCFEFDCKQ